MVIGKSCADAGEMHLSKVVKSCLRVAMEGSSPETYRTIAVESTIGWFPAQRGVSLAAPFLDVSVSEQERRTDQSANRVWWAKNEKTDQ